MQGSGHFQSPSKAYLTPRRFLLATVEQGRARADAFPSHKKGARGDIWFLPANSDQRVPLSQAISAGRYRSARVEPLNAQIQLQGCARPRIAESQGCEFSYRMPQRLNSSTPLGGQLVGFATNIRLLGGGSAAVKRSGDPCYFRQTEYARRQRHHAHLLSPCTILISASIARAAIIRSRELVLTKKEDFSFFPRTVL